MVTSRRGPVLAVPRTSLGTVLLPPHFRVVLKVQRQPVLLIPPGLIGSERIWPCIVSRLGARTLLLG